VRRFAEGIGALDLNCFTLIPALRPLVPAADTIPGSRFNRFQANLW
jgi:hypothetical protein